MSENEVLPPQQETSKDVLAPHWIDCNRKVDDKKENTFARVENGGMCVALQPGARKILLIGGGRVAADRLRAALGASYIIPGDPNAKLNRDRIPNSCITVVCPEENMCAEVQHRLFVEPWGLNNMNRTFKESDLDGRPEVLDDEEDKEREHQGVWLVLVALENAPEESKKIAQLCRKRGILVNVADMPEECDFYFGSMIRKSTTQIMVSTNGGGPGAGVKLREYIGQNLPENADEAVASVKLLRDELKAKYAGQDATSSRRRMAFIAELCRRWTFEQLAQMDDTMRARIVDFFLTEEAKLGPDDGPLSRFRPAQVVPIPQHSHMDSRGMLSKLAASARDLANTSLVSSRGPLQNLAYGFVAGAVAGAVIGRFRMRKN